MLISARWFPTISPILPLSVVAVTHTSERTPLRASLLSFVLSPRFLNGEIGRTLNGQHIDPEGQDICAFPWKLKAHEHGDGDETACPDPPTALSFIPLFFLYRTYRILVAFVFTETTLWRLANDSRKSYEYLTIEDYIILTCNSHLYICF